MVDACSLMMNPAYDALALHRHHRARTTARKTGDGRLNDAPGG
jgi:hypothetical protein